MRRLVLIVLALALLARFGPFDRQRLGLLHGTPVITSRGTMLDLFGRPGFVRDSMIGDTYAYRLSADTVVVYRFTVAPENASNREDRVQSVVYAKGPDVDTFLKREGLQPPGTPGPSRPPG